VSGACASTALLLPLTLPSSLLLPLRLSALRRLLVLRLSLLLLPLRRRFPAATQS
jgi:hypothetical protein